MLIPDENAFVLEHAIEKRKIEGAACNQCLKLYLENSCMAVQFMVHVTYNIIIYICATPENQ